MKRAALFLAIALVLVIDGLALIFAARNRSGAPLQTIELTERELALQDMGMGSDNSAIGLNLTFHWPDDTAQLHLADLEKAGFDLRIPAGRKGRDINLLSREAYLALEFEGTAWEQWLARPWNKQYETEKAKDNRNFSSHLMLVDISQDWSELRNRYPDQSRYLIVRAIVFPRIDQDAEKATAENCRGVVGEILPSYINVPLPYASLLAPLKPAVGPPRYSVTLKYGRNLEPWVDSIKPLNNPNQRAPLTARVTSPVICRSRVF